MQQLIILILGVILGGVASYFISSHFAGTRSDLYRARNFLKKNNYEEALEHYNRFFLETRNTSLLRNEIIDIFYSECGKVFPYSPGSAKAVLIYYFSNLKQADKFVAPIFFSLVSLYKELERSNDTWVLEFTYLVINDRRSKALALLEEIENSNQRFSEFDRLFYFEFIKKILTPSDELTRSRA